MNFFRTIAVAFSMFSAVPMPRVEWDQNTMRYVLAAFPLVGAAEGLALWGWAALCEVLGFGGLLPAAGFCLIPVFMTGGIHLDGYCDTCDALASHGTPERMQEILKDPHTGAFAVIRLSAYFLASLALCSALQADRSSLFCLGCGLVLGRALSGLAVASFPLARSTGLAHTFATSADRRRVRRVLLAEILFCLALMLAAGGLRGAAMALAAGLLFWHCHFRAVRSFGGFSGDLAGWFLQRCELGMLGALVLMQHLISL